MREILNSTLLLSIVFLCIGCGSPYRQTQLNEIIESKYLLFQVPNERFEVTKEYKRDIWKYEKGTAALVNWINNTEFHIYTNKYYQGKQDKLFIKDSYYYDSSIQKEVFTQNDKETGITYKKGWIAYINYLQCVGNVYSRGFGGSYQSIGVKFYSIYCGYYDTSYKENDGKRILHVDYRYTHNPNTKDGKNREKDIKDAVKKAISTLRIKNIDIKRMEKENLMHYDKEFTSTKW